MNGSVIVGITGHQKRKGLDWNWVNATLRAELAALGNVSRALSSLAAGADQRFATAALELNIPVTAVLPMKGYERFLRGRDLARYHELLARCDQLVLDGTGRPNEAFLAAGHYIVDHCDILFAVWDGTASRGDGRDRRCRGICAPLAAAHRSPESHRAPRHGNVTRRDAVSARYLSLWASG